MKPPITVTCAHCDPKPRQSDEERRAFVAWRAMAHLRLAGCISAEMIRMTADGEAPLVMLAHLAAWDCHNATLRMASPEDRERVEAWLCEQEERLGVDCDDTTGGSQ